MAKKVSEVIQLARDSINDPLSARFNATDALRMYNRTLQRLYTDRPDMFVGSLITAPADKVLTSDVPYEDQFAQLHADMLVAEMETVPDEEQNAARAAMFEKRAGR